MTADTAAEVVTDAFVTRFPLAWLAVLPGDAVRLASLAADYGHGGNGCYASDQTLAGGLDLSRVTVNGYWRLLEVLEDGRALTTEATQRATLTRRVRPLLRDGAGNVAERYICVSAYARNTLRGNRFKIYAYARFCADTGTEFRSAQAGEKCGITGKDTLRLILRELEAEGWITCIQRGGGSQGSRYVVHDAPTPADSATPSLPGTPTDPVPDPATQNTPLGSPHCDLPGASAHRALPAVAREPVETVDNPQRAAVLPSGDTPTAERPKLPPFTYSARVHAVLLPMLHLVAPLSRWQQRQIGRAVGHAIDGVHGDVDRVADRLHRRFVLERDHIREPFPWITARGLAHRGCPLPTCESGRNWETAADCVGCAEAAADRRVTHMSRPADRPLPPVLPMVDCPGCWTPFRAAPGTRCRSCRAEVSA